MRLPDATSGSRSHQKINIILLGSPTLPRATGVFATVCARRYYGYDYPCGHRVYVPNYNKYIVVTVNIVSSFNHFNYIIFQTDKLLNIYGNNDRTDRLILLLVIFRSYFLLDFKRNLFIGE